MFAFKINYHRIPIRISKQMVKLIIKTFPICWDFAEEMFRADREYETDYQKWCKKSTNVYTTDKM